MKKIILFAAMLGLFSVPTAQAGSGNFAVGFGPVGNLFIIDSHPELDPGIGGVVLFDYRWSPELSTTVSVMIGTQNGTGASKGDNDIFFFAFPTFDIKYYLLTKASKWDPYFNVGVGMYALTEGNVSNKSSGIGLGADVGGGFDYYLTDKLTLGGSIAYRSLGLVQGSNGPGTGIFPLSLTGTIAYHF